jgi:molecular chaperone DnaK (HSP70)
MRQLPDGAAVQAHILTGGSSQGVRTFILLDVAPSHWAWMVLAGGVTTPLIKRNTTIPTKVCPRVQYLCGGPAWCADPGL